jgi:hypothetical protein
VTASYSVKIAPLCFQVGRTYRDTRLVKLPWLKKNSTDCWATELQ